MVFAKGDRRYFRDGTRAKERFDVGKSKLLIVSPVFAPMAASGAKRATRLAIKIRDYGWLPYVITTPPQHYDSTDPSAPMSSLENIPIIRISCRSVWHNSKWWRRARPGIPLLFAGICRALSKITMPLLPTDDWFPWSLLSTSAGINLVRDNKIDVIWASAPPLSALHLAYRIWKRTGVPYVVDFRDVRHNFAAPRLAKLAIRSERTVVENAAGITYVAPKQIDTLHSMYYKSTQIPSELIYNWFDPLQLDTHNVHNFARPTILHGGILYGGVRRVDGFFAALAKLRKSETYKSRQFQFLHLGLKAEMPFLTQKVGQYAVEDIVFLQNTIPEKEFESYCRGADILLLVVGHDTAETEHADAIPGKLYDYLAARRPILVVGPKGCEAGKIVRRIRRGIAVSDDDPDEIAGAIRLLLNPQDSSDLLDLSDAAAKEFESDTVVSRLSAFLKRVYEFNSQAS